MMYIGDMQEERLKEKQDAFYQKLTQFLQEQHPELHKEWEELQALQQLPIQIEELKQRIDDQLTKIHHAGLGPLWRVFEDIKQFPRNEEIERIGNIVEQFIQDVDERIEHLKEELEGEERASFKFWKKKWVNMADLNDGEENQQAEE